MSDCICGNAEGTNHECERCRFVAEVAGLKARIEALESLAGDAIDGIEEWGEYADQYFQEKWNLAGTVAGYRERLKGEA